MRFSSSATCAPEFALPTTQIVVFAILTIVVGILAAIFPARRAARLNPLQALQYE